MSTLKIKNEAGEWQQIPVISPVLNEAEMTRITEEAAKAMYDKIKPELLAVIDSAKESLEAELKVYARQCFESVDMIIVDGGYSNGYTNESNNNEG